MATEEKATKVKAAKEKEKARRVVALQDAWSPVTTIPQYLAVATIGPTATATDLETADEG